MWPGGKAGAFTNAAFTLLREGAAMPKLRLFALAALLLAATPAQADDFSGEASLTGSRTTGNTETTDIGVGLKLRNEGQVWRHKLRASADFGRAAGLTNKERYSGAYQIERTINDRLFGFGEVNGAFDKFGPFRERYFVGGGLGYSVLENDPVTWDLTGGVGYREQTAQHGMDPFGATEGEIALRLASDFDWALNENVSLYVNSEASLADTNDFLWNEVGLTATLLGNLAARASWRVDHNSIVPDGRVKTDTISRIGIVYTME